MTPEVRRLVVLGLLCGLATLVNPHGLLLYKYVLAFSGHPNLKTMREWWPMEISEGGPYVMSLVLLAFVRVLGGRKVGAAGWLVALPFALWPWFQGRCDLVVVDHRRLAPGPPGPGPRRSISDLAVDARRSNRAGPRPTSQRPVIGVSILFFPPVRTALWYGERPPDQVVSSGTPWRLALELSATSDDEGRWLPELRSALREHYPDGRFQGSVFASETQGDFLVWALPPDMPVMMFTHAHVFTADYWNAVLDVKYADGDWAAFLVRHRANLIVVESDSHTKLAEELRKYADWRVVHDRPASDARSGTAVIIAIRKNPL